MPVEKFLSALSFAAAVHARTLTSNAVRKIETLFSISFSTKVEPAPTHKYPVRVKFQFLKTAKKRWQNDYPEKGTNMSQRGIPHPAALARSAPRRFFQSFLQPTGLRTHARQARELHCAGIRAEG